MTLEKFGGKEEIVSSNQRVSGTRGINLFQDGRDLLCLYYA